MVLTARFAAEWPIEHPTRLMSSLLRPHVHFYVPIKRSLHRFDTQSFRNRGDSAAGSTPLRVDVLARRSVLQAYTKLEMDPGTTLTQVQRSWASVFDKWIILLLTKVALSTEEVTTPEGVSLRDGVLHFTVEPLFPNNEIDAGRIRHLQPLILHVWFRVIERDHPSWRRWSLLALASIHPASTNLPTINPPEPSPYIDDFSERDNILIRHLDSLIPSLPRMDNVELQEFHAFYSLLDSSIPVHSLDQKPFSFDQVFAQIVSTIYLLVCERKYTDTVTSSQTTKQIRFMVYPSLILIDRLLLGPRQAEQAIEHGFIQAVFSGVSSTLLSGSFTDIEDAYEYQISAVLAKISRYLLDYGVLRAFTRAGRKVEALEERFRLACPKLWSVWEKVKKKAGFLYETRRNIKTIFGFCEYQKCVTRDLEHIRYIRCSGCFAVFYCSQACAQLHWKDRHRDECNRGQKHEEIAPYHDMILWRHLIKSCLERNAALITKAVRDFVAHGTHQEPPSPEFARDQFLIRSGQKNPIIFIDYNIQGERWISAPGIVNTYLLSLYAQRPDVGWDREVVDSFLERWRHPYMDTGKIMVFASIPKNSSRTYPVPTGPYGFPLLEGIPLRILKREAVPWAWRDDIQVVAEREIYRLVQSAKSPTY
ncbi:hypothetical protein PM082_009674 [Marasmius tenuissimus]|nr:hypothetical protein PM082_009674 [Marasmius tenuissimus]